MWAQGFPYFKEVLIIYPNEPLIYIFHIYIFFISFFIEVLAYGQPLSIFCPW